jgi:hypothetical protein
MDIGTARIKNKLRKDPVFKAQIAYIAEKHAEKLDGDNDWCPPEENLIFGDPDSSTGDADVINDGSNDDPQDKMWAAIMDQEVEMFLRSLDSSPDDEGFEDPNDPENPSGRSD